MSPKIAYSNDASSRYTTCSIFKLTNNVMCLRSRGRADFRRRRKSLPPPPAEFWSARQPDLVRASRKSGKVAAERFKPSGVWGRAPAEIEFGAFFLKIWHLVATNVMIFLRINWPNLNSCSLNSKGKSGPKFLSVSSSHEFVPVIPRSRRLFLWIWFLFLWGDSFRRSLE